MGTEAIALLSLNIRDHIKKILIKRDYQALEDNYAYCSEKPRQSDQ